MLKNNKKNNVIKSNRKNGKYSRSKPIEKSYGIFRSKILKIVFGIIFILLLSFTLFIFISYSSKVKTSIEIVDKKEMDENIVFLGDSITYYFNPKKYFEGHHTVNSGKCGNTTKDILADLEGRVYKYNPSKIFIMIGTNDKELGNLSEDDTIKNIKEIVKLIQKNRPSAKIYIQSIYPVNKNINSYKAGPRNNKSAKKINKEIEKFCKENSIVYIDIFSRLLNSDGELDREYTTDGLHLSNAGYDVVSKILEEYL